MNIKSILPKIDRSSPEGTEIDPFCRALGVPEYGWKEGFDKTIKSYFLERWLCTDTLVGTMLHFFGDEPEPCALTVKNCRKCDTKVYFFGNDNAIRMREFLLSLEVPEYPSFECIDLSFSVPYNRESHRDYPMYAKIE